MSIDADQLTEPWAAHPLIDDNGDWMVGYIEKDKPGYWPTTYRFNADEEGRKQAKATANSINETKGLSLGQVGEIVASSFRVS